MSDDSATLKSFDFDRYLSLPRLSGLNLSPDGRRLVVAVARPDPEGKGMRTSLWQVDPEGAAPARRITRSAAGESQATFASDGSLLFTSTRPDPDAKPDPDRKIAALWRLPAEGGEATLLATPEGGVEGVVAARSARSLALGVRMHPAAASIDEDAERAKARKDAGVSALFFEEYPIRHWDDWLAPRRRRLFAAPLPTDADARLELEDLTGDAGPNFIETGFDISADGGTVVTVWQDFSKPPAIREDLATIDAATRERRRLTDDEAWYADPKFSPDGRYIACLRGTIGAVDRPTTMTLWLIDRATGEGRDAIPDLDVWPESPLWLADSSAVLFSADQQGYHAAFRLDIGTGDVTCLVREASVSDLCPTPDGRSVFALFSSLTQPPRIVRFAATGADQKPETLANSIEGSIFDTGLRIERLCTKAEDGTEIWSWLGLPPEASAEHPAPLVLWVHGGPLGAWENGWHWRWNLNMLAARGYAVLMPDPALSLGYGQRMIDRGWGQWGGAPYTDVMAATDAALERPDLDATRTAMMGGSYGGYMANWIAGHTDRFRAIVTHASLWNLRPFHGTTDTGIFWEQEMGDPYLHPEDYTKYSPAEFIADVKTPMLVIHGERDFRVPVSEALMLWTDLQRHGVPARFLYFPDENHWVLKPQNSRVWYETVLTFLDEHLLDKAWARPALL